MRHIEIEATTKYHFGSDLAVDDITLRKAPSSLQRTTTTSSPTTIQIAALPINCNFEDGLCGFKTDSSNYSSASWTRKSGTESLGNFTFLRGDNTTGSGSYLSLITDRKRALIADRATLYLPAIRSQKMTCLTFAYSLPSHTSGVIQIFQTGTNTGNATLMKQMSGYHGPHWKSTFVQFLPSFEPMQVVIEGYYSGEPGCVVTLDDIHLVEGICDVQEFKRTSRAATTTSRPTTKTSSAIVFNKTSSCPSEYSGLLTKSSCDFTSDFCNYTSIDSHVIILH
ncbi:MAM and LDL-receptor class A domain-containing protein 1-like [Mytilus galloprovincialis]|uniref:MAM and LDL-receptor class A domain-containing protein 1-like n=1 Tax=Mytilus galloprovincialis TaxID=29158 RepID=UPI003F7B5275